VVYNGNIPVMLGLYWIGGAVSEILSMQKCCGVAHVHVRMYVCGPLVLESSCNTTAYWVCIVQGNPAVKLCPMVMCSHLRCWYFFAAHIGGVRTCTAFPLQHHW
jgi:hypothetical protein